MLNFTVFFTLVLQILLLRYFKNHWYFIYFAQSNNFWFFCLLSHFLKKNLIKLKKKMVDRWFLGWAIKNINILLRYLYTLFCRVNLTDFQDWNIKLEILKQFGMLEI